MFLVHSLLHIIDVLEKWEVPPINEVSKKLEKIERAMKRQDEAIDQMRLVLGSYNSGQYYLPNESSSGDHSGTTR